MARQIVLDTETTGLSAEGGDRIIEIGCVELLNRKLTGNNLHFYVNPERDSHEDALKVHGISNEFLRDKPRFADIAEDILKYVQGAEIIIHNAAFDVGFLNKELELLGRPPFASFVETVTDTLAMAKAMFPGKRNSLNALCDRLGVDNSGRTLHGALLDAELLADREPDLLLGRTVRGPVDLGRTIGFEAALPRELGIGRRHAPHDRGHGARLGAGHVGREHALAVDAGDDGDLPRVELRATTRLERRADEAALVVDRVGELGARVDRERPQQPDPWSLRPRHPAAARWDPPLSGGAPVLLRGLP